MKFDGETREVACVALRGVLVVGVVYAAGIVGAQQWVSALTDVHEGRTAVTCPVPADGKAWLTREPHALVVNLADGDAVSVFADGTVTVIPCHGDGVNFGTVLPGWVVD